MAKEFLSPCIARLELDCPPTCDLNFMASAKIRDLAKINRVSVETSKEALRKMRRGEIVVHDIQNTQLLREHNRLDECDNQYKAPPPPGHDQ